MPRLKLTVLSLRYSSWSMRPWLALTHAGTTFGKETVEQASLLDVSNLNLNDEITQSIADGVRQLKQLRGRPEDQVIFVKQMQPGARLLLCMWIMGMKLLDNIQTHSYLS